MRYFWLILIGASLALIYLRNGSADHIGCEPRNPLPFEAECPSPL
jgi:hypothetical protein